jgi:WD40 repeat protein
VPAPPTRRLGARRADQTITSLVQEAVLVGPHLGVLQKSGLTWTWDWPSLSGDLSHLTQIGKDAVVARGSSLVIMRQGQEVRECATSEIPVGGAIRFLLPGLGNPNDSSVLVGRADGLVRLWSLNGMPLSPPLWHPRPLSAMALSPDGRWVALADHQGGLSLWDLTAGVRLPGPTGLLHGAREIRKMAFGGDGSLWVLAGGKLLHWSDPKIDVDAVKQAERLTGQRLEESGTLRDLTPAEWAAL